MESTRRTYMDPLTLTAIYIRVIKADRKAVAIMYADDLAGVRHIYGLLDARVLVHVFLLIPHCQS